MSATELRKCYAAWVVILSLGLVLTWCATPRHQTKPEPGNTAKTTTTEHTAANQTTAKPSRNLQPIVIRRATSPIGILVETPAGKKLKDVASNQAFNPASAIKLATSLHALKQLGKSHRFATTFGSTGLVDRKKQTLRGNLYVYGQNPVFSAADAAKIARTLRRRGIREVTGKLIVSSRFALDRNGPAASGLRLRNVLQRNGVRVVGGTAVAQGPAQQTKLASHSSASLRSILKVLLCYSDNYLAHKIGDALGGPKALQLFLIRETGIAVYSIKLATTSGLGVNRLTPASMMMILRALEKECLQQGIKLWHLLPVAGVDVGTLRRRYGYRPGKGSVVAKTGTLTETDGGASALVGIMQTRQGGTLYFVSFGIGGNPYAFKSQEDALVSRFQKRYGGAQRIR